MAGNSWSLQYIFKDPVKNEKYVEYYYYSYLTHFGKINA